MAELARSASPAPSVALVDALRTLPDFRGTRSLPLRDSVAAVSVGLSGGRAICDLDYEEDVTAAVDMNVVMTGAGRVIEIQGTGEEATFSEKRALGHARTRQAWQSAS